MSTGRSHFAQFLVRLFALALRLYPSRVRRDLGDEMLLVFRLKVADSTQQGAWKLIILAWREARDLPLAIASAHSRPILGSLDAYFPSTSDQTPWRVALLSLLPFFLGGTLHLVLSFQPEWSPMQASPHQLWFLLLCTLVVLAGCILGIVKKFPRWAYPYPFYLAFSIYAFVSYANFIYQQSFSPRNSFLFYLVGILVILFLPGLRSFYSHIRQDWTLLSYGLYGFAFYLLSGADYDETPQLTLLVLLPSLISLVSALAHLRIRSASIRIAALLLGSYVAIMFWLLPIFQGMISIAVGIIIGSFMVLVWGTMLTTILLAPMLVSDVIHFWRTRQT